MEENKQPFLRLVGRFFQTSHVICPAQPSSSLHLSSVRRTNATSSESTALLQRITGVSPATALHDEDGLSVFTGLHCFCRTVLAGWRMQVQVWAICRQSVFCSAASWAVESFTEGNEGDELSLEKFQKLGWSYKAVEETLVDSVESYKQAGILE
ncbi:unnamed protein product [Ilex paraguariensis]|uniref:Uncharacterized protein n=1 Tax=Ilex paraguariensis TaxID=185542 RepID=A0ABC8SFP5_9AQUA